MRPPQLADDYTPTRPVVNHAIKEVERIYGVVVFVCVIYATAPFIETDEIIRGLDIVKSTNANFAFTVTHYPYPIQRSLRINSRGSVEMLYPEHLKTRSQDLEPAYHDAGQFYWGKAQAFLDDINPFSSGSVPIILPSWRVVDIDTEGDWERAQLMFHSLNCK
jgi:N-acylneuraminate cytidylyltransferase